MKRYSGWCVGCQRFASLAGLLLAWLVFEAVAVAAPQSADEPSPVAELSAEEQQQIKTAERFLSILEKNPRRGTALDRVYGHHIEFGSLDAFIQKLRDRSQQENSDGVAWMLLGLFEAQRGNDGAAANAFRKAEQLRPQDALASYYLAQSQLRIGESQEAIASFERAIERRPARADLLEIYQQLGRVHQRAQRTDEALNVWQRLESLFPDDPRVLEQIAVTMSEEGQPALALPRYEKLAELVQDDYRRVMFQVAAAELKIKTGDRQGGIASLEGVLGNLNPESWLYRDVRRRIDEVFLRSGDQDGLVKYYQAWLEGHREDVEGMSRLARFLASSARVPEASQWMEKALKLAPSRSDLRKAFIDQLVNDQRFPEAIKQYEQLVAVAPGNPDFLRDWGKLVLRNREQPEAQRRQQAIEIWSRILAARPNDAVTVSQVADLYRQNNMGEEAEKLYRRAVELAPADPQYREYLGEFLHIQKRPDEALAVWSAIAEGDRRTAVNMTRLAEVYNSFGFADKAVLEIAEAVRRDPKDFSLQLRAAEYHSRAGKFDDALAYVVAAETLASSDDERDAVIQQRIEVLQTSQRLDDQADRLAKQLDTDPNASSDQWYLLARYMESGRRWPEAAEAIEHAMALDAKSIPALTVAARIAEASGDYGRAAELSRKLADLDRRSRGDHLMNVSRLESQLGRTAEALKAAQELILSAPGNTDHYEFYAQACFRLGMPEEGLDALRKAVRINPNDPHLIMAMGAELANQLRTDEAIEVYWRAFEKSEEIEDKVGLTMKLAPLYQQVNQFDKLVERFERDRREEDKRREMTICLAQAWHTLGDFGAARQELESLLSEDTRDTNLLNQLAKLCQDGADLEAAIGYQRQLVAIAPGHETEFPLAGMLMANGQSDEAREIFVKLTQREEDPVRQMKALDSLLTQGNFESVINVVEPLLAQHRDDWELMYREAVAWASLDKPSEAKIRLQRLLSLTLPYDSLGRSAEARLKQAQAKAKSDNLRGIATVTPQRQSPLAMRSLASQVQRSVGLVADNSFYSSGSTPPVWMPEAYGIARMAAFGWMMKFEEDENSAAAAGRAGQPDPQPPADTSASLVAQIHERASAADAPRNAIYDSLYVAELEKDFATIFSIARRLARAGGSEEQRFFLSSLSTRQMNLEQVARGSSGSTATPRTPLAEDDLQLARECYASLTNEHKSLDIAALYGGNVAYGSNGQVYVQMSGGYVMLPGVFRGEGGYLTLLADELRLAGKQDEATKLLEDHLQKAESATQLAEAMALLLKEERADDLLPYFERWSQAALKQIAAAPVAAPSRSASGRPANQLSASVLPSALNTIQKWMAKLGAEEENALILAVMDPALDVAAAEARHRQLALASQTRRSTPVRTSSLPGPITVYYGKETIRSNVTFPPAGIHLDRTAITLLKQVHEVLSRNDVATDLVDHLRKRVAASDKASETATPADSALRMHNEFCLASALWWTDEQDEAIERMALICDQLPGDLDVRFDLARMYESRGDFEDAMLLIESITPRDQQILQQRELEALQLAERLGDIDRARSAAERLFGLRLTASVQLTLVDRMRRLGLNEMADAVLARVERTSSNQASSLASLMMLYQGQGKMDQANQLAHMLLRRTVSPVSINSRTARNPLRYQTSASSQRTQALQLLHRSGALKILIAQLEAQYQRSPDSVRLIEQLIEFYGQSGQKVEAGKLLQQAAQRRPDSPILRLQLAKHYEQSGKASEACDQYLSLLKIQPNWVTSELYQVERVFTQAKRKPELVKAISSINLKSISDPYYIGQVASSLLQDDDNADVAIALLERAFEAFPQYRTNLIQNVRDERIWKNERFYRFAKRFVLPSKLDISANPWTGLSEIRSYSGNGEVDVFFHQLVNGIKSSGRIADLEKSISDLVEQQPQWMSGRAMIALIELSTGHREDARNRLQKLVSDEAAMKTIPSEACWVIGQELNRFDETRPAAMMLFEKAIESPSANLSQQLRYSPVAALVDIYSKSGRKEEARALLFDKIKNATFENFDASYASYQEFENSSWVAEKLVALEFPVDAIRLYHQLLHDPEKLKSSTQFSGRDVDYQLNNLKKKMDQALALLNASNAEQTVSQLLAMPETPKQGSPAIDLMLSSPDAKDLAKEPMKSALVELLVKISQDPQVADAITGRLAEIADQYPQDLSVAVVSAAWKLRLHDEDAEQAALHVATLVSNQPLVEIAASRRPNSRQRREAALLIPIWLIARECVPRQELQDLGQQLAAVALQAARRQLDIKEQSAILYEWGKLLAETGNKMEAEARWAELLELATKRPQRAKPTDPARGANRPAGRSLPDRAPETQANKLELIPPLTLSQFRAAITVAKSAAAQGMSELSRKAVSESLKGGFPIADPVAVDPNAAPRTIIRSYSSPRNDANPIESEVVSALKEIVLLWNGQGYPDEDTYQVLKALVLPANRPDEILVYVTVSDVMGAKIDSLAYQLVQAAKKADQLTDLLESVNRRKGDAQQGIPFLAMATLIANEQSNTDEALQRLNDLAGQVSQGGAKAHLETALSVAIKTFDNDRLKPVAFRILRQALQQEVQRATTDVNRQLSIDGKLADLVNRYLESTGDEQAVKDYFDGILSGRQAYYSRFSGDYGLYQQRQDLVTVAVQGAQLGMPRLALDYLGRTCDFEVANYPSPTASMPLAVVVKHLRTLPPGERYDAWSAWTMPANGRETIRLITEMPKDVAIPKAFFEGADDKAIHRTPAVLSNFTELVVAASEAGKLAELRSQTDALVKQGVTNAILLQTLTMIAQDDLEAGLINIDKLLASMPERLKPGDSRVRPSAAGEYLVFQACMASDTFSPRLENRLASFRKQLLGALQYTFVPLATFDWANRASATMKWSDWPVKSPFKYWLESRVDEPAPTQRPWWANYGDQLVHLSGLSTDTLYFRYPLTGDFTVSMERFDDPSARGEVGYGGINFTSQFGSGASIRSVSGHDFLNHPGEVRRVQPGFSRIAIEVRDGRVKYFENKALVYEEDLSHTSPWLALVSEGSRIAAFRNLRIEGSPVIPRRVELFSGDRMDGWDCSKFAEAQPRRRMLAAKPSNENDALAYYQQQEPATYDWSVTDGILDGRAQEQSGELDQSWIHYHRPLQDGESFEYEFYYVPGESVAYPTVGRLAMMLEPDGVKSHWIATPKWDDVVHGIPLDNAVVEQGNHRGPAELPLKAQQWNRVQLSLRDNVAVVSLNGIVVFERPREVEVGTRVGIFRFKRQSAKVRNAFIAGDWPPEFSDDLGANVAAVVEPSTPDMLRVIATVVEDAMVVPLAGEVVKTAREMQPNRAFDYLKDWVLPSASHPNLRLYYSLDNPATDSTTASDRPAGPHATPTAMRLGAMLCPAVELVRVADAAGKRDELVERVGQLRFDDLVQIRNHQALKALIAIETGTEPAARIELAEVWKHLAVGLPKKLPPADRAAEVVVAWRAAQVEALRTAALEIVRELRDSERDAERKSEDAVHERHVNALFGDIELAIRSGSARDASPPGRSLMQWTKVPYLKPELKARGYRPSDWIAARGSLQHVPAETWSQLYFQSPLRGQFEIIAEHSTYGHREISIAYGMHAAQPLYDLSTTQVTTVMHGAKNVGGQVVLPAWDVKAETRIQVDGNKVQTRVNGQLIHEEVFDNPPDPWLVIQAAQPTHSAVVSNLRIIGSPQIPSEIDLIGMAGWAAWRADVYGESHSTGGDVQTPWTRVGDELTGRLRAAADAAYVESLLLYQRPMLEDGVIEFETWYEPDKFEVHPALGPDAFLIRPEGIAQHRLTNAQYEDSELLPGNEQPIATSASKLPLKVKDWNLVRLTLQGDNLTISINGEDVVATAVTALPHERQFGLFRYSNKTQCRVRKLVYRGNWPKSLPPLEEQELAYPAAGPFAWGDAEPSFDEVLNQPLEILKAKGFSILGGEGGLQQRDRGILISQHTSTGGGSWPGFIRRAKINGDMELTVEYRDAQMVPAKVGWGTASGLFLTMDDPEQTRVECLLSLNKDAQLVYKTQLNRSSLDGKKKTYDQIVLSNAPTSGRLKMVRAGGEVHCLAAAADSAQFRLLASFAVGSAPIADTGFQSKCSDSDGRSDLTLERWTVRQR